MNGSEQVEDAAPAASYMSNARPVARIVHGLDFKRPAKPRFNNIGVAASLRAAPHMELCRYTTMNYEVSGLGCF